MGVRNGVRHVWMPLVRQYFGFFSAVSQGVMVGCCSYLPGFTGIWIFYYSILLTNLYR